MAFNVKFTSTDSDDSFLFSLFATFAFVYVSVNIYFAFNCFCTILSFDHSSTLLFYFLSFLANFPFILSFYVHPCFHSCSLCVYV